MGDQRPRSYLLGHKARTRLPGAASITIA